MQLGIIPQAVTESPLSALHAVMHKDNPDVEVLRMQYSSDSFQICLIVTAARQTDFFPVIWKVSREGSKAELVK